MITIHWVLLNIAMAHLVEKNDEQYVTFKAVEFKFQVNYIEIGSSYIELTSMPFFFNGDVQVLKLFKITRG